MIRLLAQLGIGVVVAWVALPVLTRLAQATRNPAPGARERTLVLSLGLAAATLLAPFLLQRPGVAAPAVSRARGGGSPAAPAKELPPLAVSPLAAIGALWLCALAFRGLRRGVGHLRLLRRMGPCQPAPARVGRLVARVCQELGIGEPRVVVGEGVSVPFVAGVFSPWVALPGALLPRLSDLELELVLRHELIHVARGDVRMGALVELLMLPFAGHPLIRRVEAELVLAREAAVDLRASAADPHRYASLLLDVAAHHQAGLAVAGAVAMGRSALNRRIDMLIDRRPKRFDRLSRSLVVLAFLGLAGALLLAPRISIAGGAVAAPRAINLKVGATTEVDLGPVKRIALEDPGTAEVVLLEHFKLSVVGKAVGKTRLLVWRTDGGRDEYEIIVTR